MMNAKTLQIFILLFASNVFINGIPSQSSPFDPSPWIQDFEQLKKFLADGYPNFETMVELRKLKPAAMNKATLKRLNQAKSADESKRILKNFLADFGDPHLKLVLPDAFNASEKAGIELTKDTSGEAACIKPGVPRKDNNFLFPALESFYEVSTDKDIFKAGLINTKHGRVGILRIHSFVPAHYPAMCIEEWNEFRQTLTKVCDEECQSTFLHHHLENRLLSELEKAVLRLKAQKIRSLVIDLTHNGGGSSWESGAIEMFAVKELMCGQTGFIRHTHWAKFFEEDIRELELRINAEANSVYEKRLKHARQHLREAKKNCNRDKIWLEEKFNADCSLVVKMPQEICDASENYKFKVGIYSGPLFIMVDSYTASAAEDFAARLKENKIAIILGEKTLGAGCGYTNGGIVYQLKNSNLFVKIPDCVRYLSDGQNEVAGILPDIELSMQEIRDKLFLARLAEVLEAHSKL